MSKYGRKSLEAPPDYESLPAYHEVSQAYHLKEKLVVALDFGTTYSGIAYAFADDQKPEVMSIQQWPGLMGFSQSKIPTKISYDPADNTSFTWGAQRHKHGVVEGIKLLLDPDQPRPIYLPESTAKADLRRLEKPPVDVVADYIRELYKHAMSQIESRKSVDVINKCQKTFVITVPAVWSDQAKDLTMKAAKQAGIHPVTLIKEPEAAALHTLHTMAESALKVGDAFIVCDAGGGTVDLISYEILRLKPRLELKELVPGKGCMAGSLGLNKRFVEAVKQLVDEEQFYNLRRLDGLDEAVEYFENFVKRSFHGDKYREYQMIFPMNSLKDDPINNLMSSCWIMQMEDIKAIFDPLIAEIERYVEEQVQGILLKRMHENHPKANEVKAIFLVGGFGSNHYLKSRLGRCQPHIQVVQPEDAWSAIVKGAVLSQLPQKAVIVSTQATKHYGVSSGDPYDHDIDKGRPKEYDPSHGIDRVQRMTWYIHRGEDLKREQTIKFPFFRSIQEPISDQNLICMDKLLQSDDKVAPVHPIPGSTSTNCVLTVDLRKVDRRHFKSRVGADGIRYADVHYDLVVSIKSAAMKFSVEVDGKEMGSVNAKYD